MHRLFSPTILVLCALLAVSHGAPNSPGDTPNPANGTHNGPCPEGDNWYYISGKCYLWSSETEGWFGAEKACQSIGGQLPVIQSQAEHNYLRAIGKCDLDFWIGMVKANVRNNRPIWWNNHSLDYTSPLYTRSNDYFDCYFLWNSMSRWYNTYCQSLHRIVCMTPPREGFVSDKSVDATHVFNGRRECPDGWLAIQDSCYYVSNTTANYFNAQISCESMGATIASVHSEREQNLLNIALGCGVIAWIGLEKVKPCLTNPNSQYCWVWMDGKPLTYSSWRAGHPSTNDEIECVTTHGRWSTTNCYNRNTYVCRKDL